MRDVAWGHLLRTLIKNGWTAKAIANRIGCGQASVSRWKRDIGIPEPEWREPLMVLFEENARLLNPVVAAEVAASEEMKVLLTNKSVVVSISESMKEIMMGLGIRAWETEMTEDGLLRIITIRRAPRPE